MSSLIKRAATAATSLALVVGLGLTAGTAAAGASSDGPTTARAAAPIAQNAEGTLRSHIVGTAGAGRKVTGTFTPLRVIKKHGGLRVRGLVQGVVHQPGRDAHFAALRSVPLTKANGVRIGNARMAIAARTCSVLHLTLGPLDLNLLGLTVHLDRVVLNIDAQSGSGNLLGNLLCSVAGLLDGGPLSQLSGLLNRILGLLNLSA
jgi:hypothetical protein